jgi:hypothetical protein
MYRIGDPTRRDDRRRIAIVIIAAAIVTTLWSLTLFVSLPRSFNARQWELVWVGFDVLLLGPALTWTGWLLYQGRLAAVMWCVACATLLVCDAWFDVTTSFGTSSFMVSLALAAFVELPVAVWFLWMAHRIRHNQLVRVYELLGADPDSIDTSQVPIFDPVS